MSLFDIKNKQVRHQFLQNYNKDMDKIVENRQHLQKSEIKKQEIIKESTDPIVSTIQQTNEQQKINDLNIIRKMDMIENNLKETSKKLIKSKEDDDNIDYEGIDVKSEINIEEIDDEKIKSKPKSEPKFDPKYVIINNVSNEDYNKMIKYGIVKLKTPDNKENIIRVSRYEFIPKEKADKIVEKKEQIEEKEVQRERKNEVKKYENDITDLVGFLNNHPEINLESYPKISS